MIHWCDIFDFHLFAPWNKVKPFRQVKSWTLNSLTRNKLIPLNTKHISLIVYNIRFSMKNTLETILTFPTFEVLSCQLVFLWIMSENECQKEWETSKSKRISTRLWRSQRKRFIQIPDTSHDLFLISICRFHHSHHIQQAQIQQEYVRLRMSWSEDAYKLQCNELN